MVEILVTITVIGIIAAIAFPSIGGINSAAKVAEQQRNAQSIANVFTSAIGSGANFSAVTDLAGVITILKVGVSSPNGLIFQVPKSWGAADETAFANYLTFTAGTAGGQPTLDFSIGR